MFLPYILLKLHLGKKAHTNTNWYFSSSCIYLTAVTGFGSPTGSHLTGMKCQCVIFPPKNARWGFVDVITKMEKLKIISSQSLLAWKHNYIFYVFRGEGHACQKTYWLAILLSTSVKEKHQFICQRWSESMLHEILMISIKLITIIIVTAHWVSPILSAKTLQTVCHLILTKILCIIPMKLMRSPSW